MLLFKPPPCDFLNLIAVFYICSLELRLSVCKKVAIWQHNWAEDLYKMQLLATEPAKLRPLSRSHLTSTKAYQFFILRNFPLLPLTSYRTPTWCRKRSLLLELNQFLFYFSIGYNWSLPIPEFPSWISSIKQYAEIQVLPHLFFFSYTSLAVVMKTRYIANLPSLIHSKSAQFKERWH